MSEAEAESGENSDINKDKSGQHVRSVSYRQSENLRPDETSYGWSSVVLSV